VDLVPVDLVVPAVLALVDSVDLVPVDLVVPAVLALVDSVDLVPVALVAPPVPVLLADLVAVLHHAVPVVRADHNVKRPPVAVGIPRSSSRR
jgi:hypothetical protein